MMPRMWSLTSGHSIPQLKYNKLPTKEPLKLEESEAK